MCVYLYLCCFTCACATSEPRRGADLTATVPEHTDYLLNMPRASRNRTSFNVPGRTILQLSLSAQQEPDFHRLFAPFQPLNSFAWNVPKASENLATDSGKLKPAHEICESCYWMSNWHGQLLSVLVVVSLAWAFGHWKQNWEACLIKATMQAKLPPECGCVKAEMTENWISTALVRRISISVSYSLSSFNCRAQSCCSSIDSVHWLDCHKQY